MEFPVRYKDAAKIKVTFVNDAVAEAKLVGYDGNTGLAALTVDLEVIIGDITNIRRNKNLGKVTNQKLHALPYAKIYGMLEYKLAMHGITLAKQTEEYSSQCSPHAPQVTKEYAKKC